MIRILAVDDSSDFHLTLGELKGAVEDRFGRPVKTQQINPNNYVSSSGGDIDSAAFLKAVAGEGASGCDICLIDIYLHDGSENMGPPSEERLYLVLEVAKTFRQCNQSAIVVLYSGTLAKFIKELVGKESSSSKMTTEEKNFHAIFENRISGFSSRDDLEVAVLDALEDLPLILRIEKELLTHGTRKVRGDASSFKGMTFIDLAGEVRKQSAHGRHVVGMVAQHGIAAVVDLNM